MRIAVDIGGTFTDVLLYNDATGELGSAKVLSNPREPDEAFMEGIHRVMVDSGAGLQDVSLLVHGTTLVTNALLEKKTARVGLLVTAGFRDLLEIGRQQRPDLYDLMADRLPPLVPRQWVREIQERIGADGEIVLPLDERDARNQIQALKEAQIETLAVALLFSFSCPDHEVRLKELASDDFPEQFIFVSSQVSPEFREFERVSTTVVAAAVAPMVVSYLRSIQDRLTAQGGDWDNLIIMHSGGGTLPAQEVIKRPHTMIESGPAAGLIAAGQLAQASGVEHAIAFDMGGTTAKSGLILSGQPQYTTRCEVGGALHHGGYARGDGYPVRFPMIDVVECGAGAGSIAWVDAGGHLKVGPQSAGADPGPACYGKGGTHPTVTDAYLVLGYLSPDSFLGGEMVLDPERATRAIREYISIPLNITLEDAALGVIRIANVNMLRILRLISVARGYDPRHFILVAYGGAGPLHAIALAEEMSIERVIVPRFPGLFSALGLLYADVATDFVETVMKPLSRASLGSLKAALTRLKTKSEAWFRGVDASPEERTIQLSADLRYLRQNYELAVQLPGSDLSPESVLEIRSRFHRIHASEYGHSAPEEPIQVVNLRLRAVKVIEKLAMPPLSLTSPPTEARVESSRTVWFTEGCWTCQVYNRDALRAGHTIEGPVIIQEKEATTLVKPGWQLQVDHSGNLVLTTEH